MKRKLVIVLIALVCVLCGCGKTEQINKKNYVECEENEKLLYDRYNQRIIAYDLIKKKDSGRKTDINDFQYEYAIDKDIYISGNSFSNGFELIELKNDSKEVVSYMKIKETEAMFPMGIDKKGNMYCVHYYYESNDSLEDIESKRCLGIIENGKIRDIPAIKGVITEGVIYEDSMYYTIFKSGEFSLYQVSLDKINEGGKVIKSGLDDDGLVVTKQGLFYSNKGYYNALNGGKKFKYKDKVYGILESKYVFQMYIGDDADIWLEVLNLDTMNTVLKKSNVYDFELKGNTLKLYGYDFIESKELINDKVK